MTDITWCENKNPPTDMSNNQHHVSLILHSFTFICVKHLSVLPYCWLHWITAGRQQHFIFLMKTCCEVNLSGCLLWTLMTVVKGLWPGTMQCLNMADHVFMCPLSTLSPALLSLQGAVAFIFELFFMLTN